MGRFMPWGICGVARVQVNQLRHLSLTEDGRTRLGVARSGGSAATVAPVLVWLLAGMVTPCSAHSAQWLDGVVYHHTVCGMSSRRVTRASLSTRQRSVVGNRLRYHAGVPWLEHVYVVLLVIGAVLRVVRGDAELWV